MWPKIWSKPSLYFLTCFSKSLKNPKQNKCFCFLKEFIHTLFTNPRQAFEYKPTNIHSAHSYRTDVNLQTVIITYLPCGTGMMEDVYGCGASGDGRWHPSSSGPLTGVRISMWIWSCSLWPFRNRRWAGQPCFRTPPGAEICSSSSLPHANWENKGKWKIIFCFIGLSMCPHGDLDDRLQLCECKDNDHPNLK